MVLSATVGILTHFQLNIGEEEVLRLVVEIVHDRKRDLRIDQINRTLLVVGPNAAKREEQIGDIPEGVGHIENNGIDPARSSALMKLLGGLEQVNSTLAEKAV